MKILKSGTKNKAKEITTDCRCGCKFRFNVSEARFESDQRDGDAYVIKCPECQHENWISVGATGYNGPG